MNKRNIKLAKKIVGEYVRFMRKTSRMIKEAKRATILSLKRILKLKNGDFILIKDDGSFEIKSKE